MLKNTEFDPQGCQRLTVAGDSRYDTQMNIWVQKLVSGQQVTLCSSVEETAVLLLSGHIRLCWEDNCREACRSSVFEEAATCLHVCHSVQIRVEALEESEILVQRTENPGSFPSKLYTQADCKTELFGEGVWDGTALRQVVTIFDYQNAPYSNMVMGEVFNLPGRWSSYIPHSHDQPEVYYYRFDKPQGFGACFIGEQAFRITHCSHIVIPGGQTHPQVTAPGYKMYYCWMIRHLENNPWTDRVNDPQHSWLLE